MKPLTVQDLQLIFSEARKNFIELDADSTTLPDSKLPLSYNERIAYSYFLAIVHVLTKNGLVVPETNMLRLDSGIEDDDYL